MKNRLFVIASLLAGSIVLVAGCDSVDVIDVDDRVVRPTVTIHFVNANEAVSKLADGQAIIDVELIVTSPAGIDYSPAPVQVDDTVDDEAGFELSLPPDSVYSFSALLTRNDELIAEGRVLQLITGESSEVTLPVVVANEDPFFALIPSQIEMDVTAGTIDLEMRLYGNRSGIVGLAVEMLQSGPAQSEVSFNGVDIVETDGGRMSLAWQFAQGGAPLGLGTIEVPVDEAADFCLDVETGGVRVVNTSGQIRIIGGTGACVHVIQ